MEVLCIIFKEVRRGQIRATAKPPQPAVSLKVTIVEMHRGCHGIFGMHHRRHSTSKERHRLAWFVPNVAGNATVRRRLDSLGGHFTVDDRHVDPSLFKHRAVLQNTRNPTTAILSNPRVLPERAPNQTLAMLLCVARLYLFNRLTYRVLRFAHHLFEFDTHHPCRGFCATRRGGVRLADEGLWPSVHRHMIVKLGPGRAPGGALHAAPGVRRRQAGPARGTLGSGVA
mmetsp:Transcript_20594/g.50425  ORF Transcript_20594/g.50425 Transcript_20594/m.50425 type:complete len:227 (+) Transcript_20594:547-1227(+)